MHNEPVKKKTALVTGSFFRDRRLIEWSLAISGQNNSGYTGKNLAASSGG